MRALPVVFAALLVPSLAAAQDTDPEAARTSAGRTIDCLERVNHDLENTMRLLRDASRSSSGWPTSPAR